MNEINCQQALARLYEYLDAELATGDADAIREHFELCQRCYPHLRFARAFQEMLQRVAEGQPAAPAHLRQKLLGLLRAEGLEPGS